MSEPLRVTHVIGKMVGGGVESVVMTYYRHIDRDRIQFDFVIDDDSTVVPEDEILELGGRIYRVAPYQHLSQYKHDLARYFAEEKPHIVHSHINTLSVFPLHVAKKAGVPVRIAHSHSTAGKGEFKKNALKYALRPFANLYPTARLACSEYAGHWLFQSAPFQVLYNAIELDKFAFDADIRREVRSELGIGEKTFVVGHIGRFTAQKNQSFLLDAFARVVESAPDCALLFIGSGNDSDAIKARVQEYGLQDKVRLLGQRNDANRLYQAMDLFALPSLYEGFGIVAIEAQRAGLSCLVSDAVPDDVYLTDLVSFLPLGDADKWAKAMLTARFECEQCDRGSYYGKRAGVDKKAFERYDIEKAAPKLVAYYEGLNEAVGV